MNTNINITVTVTVTALLEAEGRGPWLSYEGFSAAVRLAEAVSQTIEGPIRRAVFVAEAAATLDKIGPSAFETLESEAACLAETAEEARSTPCGSQELWGSLLAQAEFQAQVS